MLQRIENQRCFIGGGSGNLITGERSGKADLPARCSLAWHPACRRRGGALRWQADFNGFAAFAVGKAGPTAPGTL